MSDEDYIDKAEGMSPADATEQGISGVILAIFGGMVMIVEAFFEGISKVIGVLSDFRDLIGAFFTSPIQILEETAAHTAQVLTTGEWAFFGPATWAVGVFSIVLGFWVWTLLDPDIPFIDNLLPWR